MSHYGFRLTLLFLSSLALAATGCGRTEFSFFPVEGTVTKGGRPLGDIEVIFLADPDAGTVGPRASGTTDEAGHYRLRTANGDEGAVAGKHLVLLLDLEAAKKQLSRRFRRPQQKEAARLPPEITQRLQDPLKTEVDAPRVPTRYRSLSETPLRIEVHSGPQVIDFDVQATGVEVK